MLIVILVVWAVLWAFQHCMLRYGSRIGRKVLSLGLAFKHRFVSNPMVRQWVLRYPSSVQFFAERVDYSRFFGLPLTLLILSLIFTLVLFADITEDVVTADSIVIVDHVTARLVSLLRAPEFIPVAIWITDWCAPPVVGVLLIVACLSLWLMNRKFAITGLLISLLGASLLSTLGKLIFQRLRPDSAVLLESSYSFPSSHAALSVAFYGFLGYLLIRSVQKWDVRIRLFCGTIGVMLLIGLSRVVLGVHYLSDVWAGYLIGLLWLIVGISVNEWLAAIGRIIWNLPVDPYRKAATHFIVLTGIIGVAGYLSARELTF